MYATRNVANGVAEHGPGREQQDGTWVYTKVLGLLIKKLSRVLVGGGRLLIGGMLRVLLRSR